MSFKLPASKGRPGVTDQQPKTFRWNTNRDISLITSIVLHQPFLASGKTANRLWELVASEIREIYDASVQPLGAKRRFSLLLSSFKSEDFKNRHRSGTEEEVTTIKEKLALIASLIDDSKLEKSVEEEDKAARLNDEKAAAEDIRGASLTGRKTQDSPVDSDNTKRRRLSEKSLSEMWYENQLTSQRDSEAKMKLENQRLETDLLQREKDRELRMREIQLKEKQLELEKSKEERRKLKEEEELKLQQQRFELEREERSTMLTTQKIMLEILKNKLN